MPGIPLRGKNKNPIERSSALTDRNAESSRRRPGDPNWGRCGHAAERTNRHPILLAAESGTVLESLGRRTEDDRGIEVTKVVVIHVYILYHPCASHHCPIGVWILDTQNSTVRTVCMSLLPPHRSYCTVGRCVVHTFLNMRLLSPAPFCSRTGAVPSDPVSDQGLFANGEAGTGALSLAFLRIYVV